MTTAAESTISVGMAEDSPHLFLARNIEFMECTRGILPISGS